MVKFSQDANGNLDMDPNGSTLTVDQTNDRVGIGTMTPSTLLEVAGTATVSTLTDGTLSITGGTITSSTLASPIITGVIALNSDSTTVPPLTLTANSLNDGVGALRIDSVEPDIYLNDTNGGFTTVTFANAGTASAAFGRNSSDDFYITVTADGGSNWRNDTFVVDHDTGNITVGYKFNVGTGDLRINGTDITASATELNQLTGVTLGTAASSNTGDFATAAQGATADTALQTVAVDGVTITGDGAGIPLSAVGGGGGTPGGNPGEIQFNSAGSFGGDANLFWDDANDRLGIGTSSPASSLHIIGAEDSNPEIRIERSGVPTQYLGLQNEDASGAIVSSHSSEGNKKALYLQSVHSGGGSAAGDNAIIVRTGADGAATTRMIVSDTSDRVSVESGTYLLVDDQIRVGSTSLTPTDYSLSVQKSASSLSGGLFSSSVGETSITNDNAGWWLSAGGMNTTSKYTPAIKFGSTDSNFTTDNPKWLAGIVGRATQTYSSDTTGAMALDFLTFPSNGGADGGPTTRMTIDGEGRVGIGTDSPNTDLHIVESSNPELRLQESGQNGYTSIFGYADNYGAIRVNNDTGTESTLLDLEADSNGTGAQTVRLFRTSSATASATKLQILSPGTTTETFAVDASNGNIETSGTITQSVTSAVLVADGSGVLGPANFVQDINYQEIGGFAPQVGPAPSALPGAIDPFFPMDPAGWATFEIDGTVYYLPAYTFSPP